MKAIHGTFLYGSKCRNAHSAEKLKPPGAKQFFRTGMVMIDRLPVVDFTLRRLFSRSVMSILFTLFVVSVVGTMAARPLFQRGNLA
jgi:hypothetical protein